MPKPLIMSVRPGPILQIAPGHHQFDILKQQHRQSTDLLAGDSDAVQDAHRHGSCGGKEIYSQSVCDFSILLAALISFDVCPLPAGGSLVSRDSSRDGASLTLISFDFLLLLLSRFSSTPFYLKPGDAFKTQSSGCRVHTTRRHYRPSFNGLH